jgi:hypothetical protein
MRIGLRAQLGTHLLGIRGLCAGPQPDKGMIRVAGLHGLFHLAVDSEDLVLRTLRPAAERAYQETETDKSSHMQEDSRGRPAANGDH